MSKKCARCEKTVYPLEEMKCLDKVWHKTCFKCQECGMTLNMRTYKGFNRLPYCNAHCPQAKHTTVADTPEIRRIQENTKIQSSVKYHEDFEKQKGKVTQIADDPETLRIKQNTRIISNVAYHGDLQKKAMMEQRRPAASADRNGDDSVIEDAEVMFAGLPTPTGNDPPPTQPPPVQPPPLTVEKQEPEPISTIPTNQARGGHHHRTLPVNDLDPGVMKDSPYSNRQTSTVIYTSEHGPVLNPTSRRVGSIADYDPINDNYGSLATGVKNDANAQMKMAMGDVEPHISQPAHKSPGATYLAMYDYAAADVDEVSFLDGDLILNCTPIDEGWMTGTVQRSGQTGMLPANYVAPLN